MALRAVKPKAIEKRLKALFFGPAGVGKTTAAIQFPKAYLIDTERGAENDQYVKLLDTAGGAYFFTTDFDEVLAEVTSLMTEKHGYRTLVIDPLTPIYNDMLDKSARALADKSNPDGMAYGRHKVGPDRKIKHLLTLLLRLDMNVIITSHAKVVWGEGMTKLGNTYDCYNKLDYLFDLVFEIAKRGQDRVGIVKKTRVETFAEGEQFDFSYENIAEKYGRSVLERAAVAEALATPAQVETITRLVELLKLAPETVEKWLDKANAQSFAEMPADSAAKTIEFLESKIKGAA